jgi:hypothetical protein
MTNKFVKNVFPNIISLRNIVVKKENIMITLLRHVRIFLLRNKSNIVFNGMMLMPINVNYVIKIIIKLPELVRIVVIPKANTLLQTILVLPILEHNVRLILLQINALNVTLVSILLLQLYKKIVVLKPLIISMRLPVCVLQLLPVLLLIVFGMIKIKIV